MKYFTKDFRKFFKELSANNNKEWFHSQKKRYENSVKKPFENFIQHLIEKIQDQEPDLNIAAKDCILRINRDIRFTKDKTPYNLHRTAFVSASGRKDKSIPGIYIRLSPELVGVMGGCFGPDKDQLAAIRNAIMKDPKKIKQLLNAKAFKEKFGTIKGDQMKRIPKMYQEFAKKESLILNKQFYFIAEEKASLMESDHLMETILEYYQAMKPMNDYLKEIITKTI